MTELSGIVAVLSETLDTVEEYRDLGSHPVAVKRERVFPIIDVRPELSENQQYGEPDVSIVPDEDGGIVRRVFPVIDIPVSAYAIPKDLIWRRATDAEAEAMETALQSQSVRLRRIYDGAVMLTTDDELFVILKAAIVAMFGVSRADELLAPE